MIRFALTCGEGHSFDAWFSSGDSYDEQIEAEAIRCPACGSAEVRKAPMAPAVLRGQGRDGSDAPSVPEAPNAPEAPKVPAAQEGKQSFAFLKGLREHLKANADDVGEKFTEEARKIHYGESKERNIYGEATLEEAKSLNDEGIPALPLPKLPEEHN